MGEAGFYRYETETLTIQLDPADALTDFKDVVVSIHQQNGAKLDRFAADLDIDAEAGTIGIYLSQEDTGQFKAGTATVQVNIYFVDTERDTTATGQITVYNNLYPKVMT